MFNASNSSWNIIMKARITIKDIKTKMKQKEKGTEPDSNLTRARA